MSSLSHKNDEFIPPGRSASKLGYFKATHVKVSFDEQFKDFLEMFKYATLSGVCMKRAKDGSSRELC
ncbi:hypothetical protein DVH24_000034 [Malus domestica]|uniref:Uncharacterized protein n=1 Tax=Malus domestica TaxID=3750 RepID=A0A498J1A5_MALDO|nr:hypothetical protein DVH24_000034 [Malus domestica]